MEDSADLVPTYDALASELIEELGSIAQAVGQPTLNATRGEMAVLHALYHADGPLTPGALASAGAVSSARVANILRALEEKGVHIKFPPVRQLLGGFTLLDSWPAKGGEQ